MLYQHHDYSAEQQADHLQIISMFYKMQVNSNEMAR